MTPNKDQLIEIKVTEQQLIEVLKARFPAITSPCSFCGGRDPRNIMGIHWMSMSRDFAYLVKPVGDIASSEGPPTAATMGTPATFVGPAQDSRPAAMPCIVLTCSACGNTWLLSLNALGIFNVERRDPPALRLVRD